MVLAEWWYCFDTSSLSVTCHCLKLDFYLLILCSQSAVLRGAALRGLEGLAPRIKHARRHYGVSGGSHFRENIDPEYRSYIEPMFNQKYCTGRMKWLISKVISVPNGRKYRIRVEFGPLTMCLFREMKSFKVHLGLPPGPENTTLEENRPSKEPYTNALWCMPQSMMTIRVRGLFQGVPINGRADWQQDLKRSE